LGDAVERDGVGSGEEGRGRGLDEEVDGGMQFGSGYSAPYMVTNGDRMEAELGNRHLLVTDKRISAVADIVPVLEKLVQVGNKNLLVIAEDIDGEALATLVVNKLRGIFNVLGVKAPGFGDRRKEMLGDIAVTARRLAQELGKWPDTPPNGEPLHDAFYRTYFVDTRNLGDPAVLYDVVGWGTAMLSHLRPGEMADVLGPLGRPFEIARTQSQVPLVGGGGGRDEQRRGEQPHQCASGNRPASRRLLRSSRSQPWVSLVPR